MGDNWMAAVAAGTVRAIVSHPLDTLRVWAQAGVKPSSLSLGGLYRGAGVAVSCNATISAFIMLFEHALHAHTGAPRAVTGAATGVAAGLLSIPVDLLRIQMQLGVPLTASLRRLPRSEVLLVSLVRELGTTAVFFSAYHALLAANARPPAASALAGVAACVLGYPVDVVRTRCCAGGSLRGAWRAGGLHTGLALGVARAALTNAVAYAVYHRVATRRTVCRVRRRWAAGEWRVSRRSGFFPTQTVVAVRRSCPNAFGTRTQWACSVPPAF